MKHKHYRYIRIDQDNNAHLVIACSKKQMKNAGINLSHEWVRFEAINKLQEYLNKTDAIILHSIDVTTYNY